MAIHTLNHSQTFNPGCDLWIIPNEQDHTILKKMDWYLNFQLTKTALRPQEEISTVLKSILNENELPAMTPTLSESPSLMVFASPYLPTQKVIEISEQKTKQHWVITANDIWMGLKRPSLKVFLPRNTSAEDFESLWPKEFQDEVSVVPLK